MAATAGGGGGGGGAKAAVAEQIAQAVRSTSNLLQLMEQSSPAQVSRFLSPSRLGWFSSVPVVCMILQPFADHKNQRFGNFLRN
jgi:hypothetical protein